MTSLLQNRESNSVRTVTIFSAKQSRKYCNIRPDLLWMYIVAQPANVIH